MYKVVRKLLAVISLSLLLSVISLSSASANENTTGTNSGVKVESLSKFYKVPSEANSEFKKDPLDLLPAWRYGFTGDLHTSVPTSNFAQRVMTLFGSIFLWLSAFIWSILLFILKYALSLDLAKEASQAINNGFKGLSDVLFGSGIVFVLAAFVLITVLRYALTASFGKVVRVIAGFLIPVALLQGLSTTASGTTDANQIPKGSPAWLAAETSAIVDQFGASLGQGFGLLPGARLDSYAKLDSKTNPTCMAYYQTLYNQFDAYSNPVTTSDIEGVTMSQEQRSAFTTGSGQLKTLSRLWERAWLSTYSSAQFGDTGSGSKIICHRLEDTSKIAQDEQKAIADASLGYPLGSTTKLFNYRGGSEHEAQMLGWAACEVNGGKMRATKGWKEIAGVTDLDCENWLKTGVLEKLNWKNTGIGPTGWFGSSGGEKIQTAAEKARSGADAELRAAVDDVLSTVTNFKGEKSGRALVSGFIAFLLSLIYLWILGSLGLGAVIAQLGMVLTLVLLPGTLLLLALPNGSGKGPGQKLLKLTIAFTFAKLVFTTIIVLIMQSIAMFEQLLPTSLAMGGLSYALAPLASIFVVKYILKQLGLGDITSLSGSLGMASGGAFAASGDSKGRGVFSTSGAKKASDLTSKTGKALGTDRADAAARKAHRAIRRAPGAPLRAIDRKAKLSERGKLEYAERKTQLLGRKNEDGELVEYGLAQQLSSMAGVIAAAKGSKLLKNATNSEKPLGKALDWAANSNPEKASRANLITAQRAQRRSDLAQERFKTKEQRLAIRKERNNARIGMLSAISQLGEGESIAKNSLGEVQLDETGKPLIRTKDGSLRSSNELFNDDSSVLGMSKSFMDTYEISPEQFTVGKNAGIGPTVIPQGRDSSGRIKLVKAKTEDSSIKLAQNNPNMFIDGAEHRPVGMSSDAFSLFQWNLQVAAGVRDIDTGATVDVMKEFGVDVSTEEGRAEFRKALAGEESKLDKVRIAVSPHAYMAALASAREYDAKSGLGASLKESRFELTSSKCKESIELISDKSSAVNGVMTQTSDISTRVLAASEESYKASKNLEIFTSSNDVDMKADNYARNRIKKIEARLVRHNNGEITLDEKTLNSLVEEKSVHEQTRKKMADSRREFEVLITRKEEAERVLRSGVEELLVTVEPLAGDAAEIERQSAFLQFSRDLIVQDSRNQDFSSVISAADNFDKNFPSVKNEKENIIIQASANLVKSLEGDITARKDAIGNFVKETRKVVKQCTDKATTAASLHAKINEEALVEQRRLYGERVRQGLENNVEVSPKEIVSKDELAGWRV
jgi:hypothetical protein